MCRDLKHENHLNNETFAPTVEWITIRMLVLGSIIEGWSMASIVFKSAFTQATPPEPIFLGLPLGCVQTNPGAKDKGMRIQKSLCGGCLAPNLRHSMLHKSCIEDMGFMCSEMKRCLFVKNDCVVALCIDDVTA